MRQLLPVPPPDEPCAPDLDEGGLRRVYAFPDGPWLRMNFVSTVDGAATGPDGRTGTINNEVDRRVFLLQRDLCDVVVVGAGTARIEGYRWPRRGDVPRLVVVSSSGRLSSGLLDDGRSGAPVALLTSAAADGEHVSAAEDALGEDAVWVAGSGEVDPVQARERILAEGHEHILCEGGPRLHAAMLAAGVVDELSLTWVPSLVAGTHPRIAMGHPGLDLMIGVRPSVLIEDTGTLLGLWRVDRSGAAVSRP